jgi:hypothetical protein
VQEKLKRRPGRLRRSPLSRVEQVRGAQQEYCERMRKRQMSLLRAYVPDPLLEALDMDANSRQESRGERLTAILSPRYESRQRKEGK